MIKHYDTNPDTRKMVGSMLNTEVKFKDTTDSYVAPSGVNLSYRKPDGTVVTTANVSANTASISGSNVTTYSSSVLLDSSGTWFFRWSCTGNYAAAKEFEIDVSPSSVI